MGVESRVEVSRWGNSSMGVETDVRWRGKERIEGKSIGRYLGDCEIT